MRTLQTAEQCKFLFLGKCSSVKNLKARSQYKGASVKMCFITLLTSQLVRWLIISRIFKWLTVLCYVNSVLIISAAGFRLQTNHTCLRICFYATSIFQAPWFSCAEFRVIFFAPWNFWNYYTYILCLASIIFFPFSFSFHTPKHQLPYSLIYHIIIWFPNV